MMYRLLTVLLIASPASGAARRACPAPAWTLNLVQSFGFRPFGEIAGRVWRPNGWVDSRGVVFLSPGRIAVYQVLPGESPPSLAPRDAPSAGGPDVLQIRILSAKNGELVKALRFPTAPRANSLSDRFSMTYKSLLPLHDGWFLVRTYGMLRLFSADFRQLATMPLVSNKQTSSEYWTFYVSPSGTQVYAVHDTDYYGQPRPSMRTRYLIDADTLQVIRVIPTDERPFGPPWGRRVPEFVGEGSSTDSWGPVYSVVGKKRRTIVVSGRPILTILPSKGEGFGPTRMAGTVLAAFVARGLKDPFDLRDCDIRPLRLDIYDLANKSLRCSIPVTKDAAPCATGFLFDVSPVGDVAVIQGTTLSLYRLGAGGNSANSK